MSSEKVYPPSWEEVALGDIYGCPKDKIKPTPDTILPFIGMDHIESDSMRLLGSSFFSEMKTAGVYFNENDILYGRLRPYLNKVYVATFEGACSAEYIVFPYLKNMNSNYLAYILNSKNFVDYASHNSTGDRPRVDFTTVSKFRIGLPPLNEQNRIVAKIEELFSGLDAGVENLTKAKEQLGIYRQSLLKHAFEGKLTEEWRKENADKLESGEVLLKRVKKEREEYFKKQLEQWEQAVAQWEIDGKPGKKPAKPRKPKKLDPINKEELKDLPDLPEGWIWAKIDSISSYEQNAIKAGPFGSALKKEYYTEAGYKIYGQEQVISGDWEYGDYYIDEERYRTLEKCKVQPGDILISLVGTVGKVLVLPHGIKPGIINPRLIKISTNDFYINYFFKYYFESSFIKNLYGLKTHGATMDVLNLSILSELPFPFFSPNEQDRIVKSLDSAFQAINSLEKTLEHRIQYALTCKQSILVKAFSGELVAQDPGDEPASRLLERIKQERKNASKPKRTRKPKLKTTRGTMIDLKEVLASTKGWVSAQEAFRQCGIGNGASTDEIEKLYEELKQQVDQQVIKVERRNDEDWLRLVAEG